jgi:hypothetical protein
MIPGSTGRATHARCVDGFLHIREENDDDSHALPLAFSPIGDSVLPGSAPNSSQHYYCQAQTGRQSNAGGPP